MNMKYKVKRKSLRKFAKKDKSVYNWVSALFSFLVMMKKLLSLFIVFVFLCPIVVLAEDEASNCQAQTGAAKETCLCNASPCMKREQKNGEPGRCVRAGIKLNTNVPFIGNCIAYGDNNKAGDTTTEVNQLNAFPTLMGALMNIVMTATLIVGFLMIVAAGVMMTTGGYNNEEYYKKGIALIQKVGMVLALLGLSGVILKLINPSFFA